MLNSLRITAPSRERDRSGRREPWPDGRRQTATHRGDVRLTEQGSSLSQGSRGDTHEVIRKNAANGHGDLCRAGVPLSAPARAQGGPQGHGEWMGELGPLKMLLRSANLSTEQQGQVQQLMQSNRSQVQPLEKQLRALREQMANKLLGAGSVTAADFISLQDQAASASARKWPTRLSRRRSRSARSSRTINWPT